jgi:phenylalanyl-tRNA synthetase beta chain
MNLLVSYNWLKDHVELGKTTPEEFARRLSLSGPSVERIHRQGEGLNKIVVGKILKVKAHPNADKLRIIETDLGDKVKDIVCGGSNLAEGQLVAVALPGSWVKWHGEGEPVEIKETKLRGADSYGMICGADEIGLVDRFPKQGEKEIVDLSSLKVAPGTPVAEALGLGDVIFDIEVTTNRPDAFSIVGLAREAAAIFGAEFLWKPAPKISVTTGKLTVENQSAKLCPRYMAVALKNVRMGESPDWLKSRLVTAGIRPVSVLVDITNYVMLELGQPMHVFDRATLKGNKIVVREARAGESLKALDGKTYEVKPGQLVIADAERPVAVAGIMGGEETGVTNATTEIVFEAATFDPVSVRRTARALNLHSDSSLRFEKGLSTELPPVALARAVELAQQLCGAEVSSAVADTRAHSYKKIIWSFRPERANELIGVKILATQQKKILVDLGFGVTGKAKTWRVTVPYWRDHDIEGERDLVEEVARVYGYANLPSVIPDGPLPLAEVSDVLAWESCVKRHLKDWGLTELMTYSFVSAAFLQKLGLDPAAHLRVSNPLTEDFEFMRSELLGSVLAVVAENQEIRPEGSVFELSNVYLPRPNDLPEEHPRLLVAVWNRDPQGSAVKRALGLAEALFEAMGIRNWRRVSGKPSPHWHPGRSTALAVGDKNLGIVGEIAPRTLAQFKIERRVAVLDLDFVALCEWASEAKSYVPVPEFPAVKRDLAFLIERHRTHAEISAKLSAADPQLTKVELFDVFEDPKLGVGLKSMAYHLEFSAADRTLTAEEVEASLERIRQTLRQEFGAEPR